MKAAGLIINVLQSNKEAMSGRETVSMFTPAMFQVFIVLVYLVFAVFSPLFQYISTIPFSANNACEILAFEVSSHFQNGIYRCSLLFSWFMEGECNETSYMKLNILVMQWHGAHDIKDWPQKTKTNIKCLGRTPLKLPQVQV